MTAHDESGPSLEFPLRGDPDLFADTIQRMLAEPEERATIIDRGIPTPSAG